MFLAIAAASLLAAGSTAPFRIPSQFTEDEIIQALVPEGEAARTKDPEDQAAPGSFVAATLETNFGFPGRRFLAVEIQGTRGACAQCPIRSIGVFDMANKTKVFQETQDGLTPDSDLETFVLWKNDPVVCLRFRTGGATLNLGGSSFSEEAWYRPSLDSEGRLSLVPIWSGVVERSRTDNTSWLSERVCGSITPREQARLLYVYRRRSVYRAPASDKDSFQLPDRASEERCNSPSSGVEIRRRENLVRSGHDLRRSNPRLSRVDHSPVPVFPFDVPFRPIPFSVRRARGEWAVDLEGRYGIRSPTGLLSLQWFDADKHSIRLTSADGVSRDIRFFPAGETFVRDHFGRIVALGWSEDETRVLVVVGLDDGVGLLLSYGRGESDDSCVGLVGDPESWEYGFVAAFFRRPSKLLRH